MDEAWGKRRESAVPGKAKTCFWSWWRSTFAVSENATLDIDNIEGRIRLGGGLVPYRAPTGFKHEEALVLRTFDRINDGLID